jgi:hypothetical protein
MKYILVLVVMLGTFNAQAEEIFPAGCTPLTVHEESINLSADSPSVVMIHNLSSIDLWVTHPVAESDASAGWATRLQAGNWSALALDQKDFVLTCIESLPGHEQQVPCAGLLAACLWSKVKMPETESGTFWAGENLSLSALTAHIGSRGVVLP